MPARGAPGYTRIMGPRAAASRFRIAGAALGSVMIAAAAQHAAAQDLHGRVVDSATAAPISGAMVELQDSTGRVLREVLTTPSGSFAVGVAVAGVYRYRVAAIGYRPRPAERLVVTAGTDVGTIALPRLVVTLPDIVARADRNSCSESPGSDSVLARLLTSANSALEVMEAAVYGGRMAFSVELVHTTSKTAGNHTVTQSDTSFEPMVAWPIRSLAPDSLRRFGFAHEMANGGEIYYGPDGAVLFADWFIAAHCYTVAVRHDSTGDVIAVHFEPAHPRHADIAGDLLLDPGTLALRALHYHLVHLPAAVADSAVGGEMTFSDATSGTWIPSAWAIWAPITPGPGWQSGRNENSGRVLAVKADSSG